MAKVAVTLVAAVFVVAAAAAILWLEKNDDAEPAVSEPAADPDTGVGDVGDPPLAADPPVDDLGGQGEDGEGEGGQGEDAQDDEGAGDDDSDAGPEPEAPCNDVLEISAGRLVPIFAVGTVGGLGAGGTYVSYDSCAAQAVARPFLDGVEGDVTQAPTGGCTIVASWYPILLAALAEADAAAPLAPGAVTASFHVSQTEHLSIVSDESSGIVTGGYSTGDPAEGTTRDAVSQWPIFSRGTIRYDPEANVRGTFVVDGEILTIEGETVLWTVQVFSWSGPSTEEFSGEEAFGTVDVICGFAYLAP